MILLPGRALWSLSDRVFGGSSSSSGAAGSARVSGASAGKLGQHTVRGASGRPLPHPTADLPRGRSDLERSVRSLL